MRALGEGESDHSITDQRNLDLFAVYIGVPIAVLRDRSIQQTVAVAGDGSFQEGALKGGEGQRGGVEFFVCLPEKVIIHYSGHCADGALFVGVAIKTDANHIAFLYLADSKHLGKTVGFVVELTPVYADAITVAFGQVGKVDAGKASPVGSKAEYHSAALYAGFIAGVAGIAAAEQCCRVRRDFHELTGELCPDITLNSGGQLQKPVLEIEGISCGLEVQRAQGGICEETQWQIGLVLQKRYSAIAVDLLEERILLHKSVPLNHIFKAQEQVGNRAAFFKAIAVVCVFCTVAQVLHKFGNLYICGAGEGGNSVIAVQCAIIQRLRMGDFCAVEQIVFLFLHITNEIFGVGGALGIICDCGVGEIHTEIDDIKDDLKGSDHTQTHIPDALTEFQKICAVVDLFLCGVFRGFLLKHGEEYGSKIQHQEHQVISDIHYVLGCVGK